MKHILIDLLNRFNISRPALNNCIAIVEQDQCLGKPSPLTHEEMLQTGRINALRLANALEAASQTSRNAGVDHAELLGIIEQQIQLIEIDLADEDYRSLWPGLNRAKQRLKSALALHEDQRILRNLR